MGLILGLGFSTRLQSHLPSPNALLQVVYKRYASLYFVMGIDSSDNELITLELVHHFVEVLDRYFGNVCELDLIFNFHKVGYSTVIIHTPHAWPSVTCLCSCKIYHHLVQVQPSDSSAQLLHLQSLHFSAQSKGCTFLQLQLEIPSVSDKRSAGPADSAMIMLCSQVKNP